MADHEVRMGNTNSGARSITEAQALAEGWYLANENNGYCHCGCGVRAPISNQSDRSLGYLKGKPRRFCQGHGRRRHPHNESLEAVRNRQAQYMRKYKDDPEVRNRIAAQQHTWYVENRERILTDPCLCQKRREGNLKWQSRLYQAFVELVDPDQLFQRHGGICGICKHPIDGQFHVDHIVPLSKGGTHEYANCQPAHPLCNMRKGNRT